MITMEMIRDASKVKKLSYYKAVYKQIPIGYVVLFNDCLYSFGINKKYRKKEILIDWWSSVRSLMGKNFFTALYKNNERAINFLVKQGMVATEYEDGSVLLVNVK
jgi:hypothetical protein